MFSTLFKLFSNLSHIFPPNLFKNAVILEAPRELPKGLGKFPAAETISQQKAEIPHKIKTEIGCGVYTKPPPLTH